MNIEKLLDNIKKNGEKYFIHILYGCVFVTLLALCIMLISAIWVSGWIVFKICLSIIIFNITVAIFTTIFGVLLYGW